MHTRRPSRGWTVTLNEEREERLCVCACVHVREGQREREREREICASATLFIVLLQVCLSQWEKITGRIFPLHHKSHTALIVS